LKIPAYVGIFFGSAFRSVRNTWKFQNSIAPLLQSNAVKIINQLFINSLINRKFEKRKHGAVDKVTPHNKVKLFLG